MKYCKKCFTLYNDGDTCKSCSAKLSDSNIDPKASVKIAEIKGRIKGLVSNALKDAGVPYQIVAPKDDVYNQFNIKVKSEMEHSVLVPFEYYSKAFDVCTGLGIVDSAEKVDVDMSTQVGSETYKSLQTDDAAQLKKSKITTIVWIVIFIVAACLIIWGIDYIAALIKSSMGIQVAAKLASFLI